MTEDRRVLESTVAAPELAGDLSGLSRERRSQGACIAAWRLHAATVRHADESSGPLHRSTASGSVGACLGLVPSRPPAAAILHH